MSKEGKLSYDENEYQTLLKFKEAYEKYHDMNVELGYMMALSGSYEVDSTYTLDD